MLPRGPISRTAMTTPYSMITRQSPTRRRMASRPFNALTLLASDAGSAAYCSIFDRIHRALLTGIRPSDQMADRVETTGFTRQHVAHGSIRGHEHGRHV